MPYQSRPVGPTFPQPNPPPPIPPISFRKPSRTPWVVAAAVAAVAAYAAYWGYGQRGRWKAKAEAAEVKLRASVAATESLNRQLATLQADKEASESEKEALPTARDNLAKSVEEKSSE